MKINLLSLTILLSTPLAIFANPDERGAYFHKKAYVPEPIPLFANIQDQLPKPILDDNAGWVDMYYKTWQLAFAHIKAPEAGSPLVSNWYDEAFSNDIFQWDMIFMTLFGKYAHHIFPGIQSLDNFYCRQKTSGCICRVIEEATGRDHTTDEDHPNMLNPPLFSWAEAENYKVTGDKSRFEHVLPVLEKYFEFVDSKRLCTDTPHQLYFGNGQSSGMDNTPRDTGRPGRHHARDHQAWVDMSAQMILQCNNIALICKELGYTEKAAHYEAKAAAIGDRMNQWMWSEADGLYYDVLVNGDRATWKTIAAFWPMLAGITRPAQDSALIANLQDPHLFWRDLVFPTLAASHDEYQPDGGYWLGAVWAPTNYAVIKGLEKTGNNAFAKEASERYIEGLYQVYLQTGTLWENYAADKINGQFKQGVNDNFQHPANCRKDFVGWTGLGPISLLIENVLGLRLNGADRILTYDLRRTDRHGIENLRMADITTTLICSPRPTASAPAQLTVTSDKPYTLNVLLNGKTYSYSVKKGQQQIDVITH